MNEKLRWWLALWWAIWLWYLNSDIVHKAVNTVSKQINNVIWGVWKWLTAVSPVAIPLGIAAGTGYLWKKLVWDKVWKWEVDTYWNTAAIWAWALWLWTFWWNILSAAAAPTVAGLWWTLLAWTALYKKYWLYWATLATATAATLAYWGSAFLLSHLWLYAADKLLFWNYLRDKFGSVKR